MDRAQREHLIELLRGLGADDPAAVYNNAREAAALVEASGLEWWEIIRPSDTVKGGFAPDFDHGDIDLDDEAGDSAIALADTADESVGQTLERLLRLGSLSAETRADVEGFVADLNAGSLDEQDRRYIQALAIRLGIL
ncbi:MAG: hypothetical protein OJI70_07165 [Zavarzinia sp.]|nr:hypothetical protein [Zavarzinia sp.]